MYLTSCYKLNSVHLLVFIDTTCHSYFKHPPDRPDFRRTDGTKFQTHLEDQIPFDQELHGGNAIDTCGENFSFTVLKALAASTPKRRPHADPRPPIPADIQDDIRLKIGLRSQWQVIRDPALRAEVNCRQRLVNRRLNESRNGQCITTLESLDPEGQSLCRMTKQVMSVHTPSPPGHLEEIALEDWESRRRKLWKTQFQRGCRSCGPRSYGDGWRGAEVLLSDPCQRT